MNSKTISFAKALCLLIVICANVFQRTITLREKNQISFERFECVTNPLNPIMRIECDIRRISRSDMKLFVRANLTEPLKSLWFHGVFYYKYNVFSYQKFPIDLWEDFCAWLKGEKSAYFLKWTAENVRNYSNLNHTCPLSGTVRFDVKRIPLNRLIVLDQMLPSGRYRVDLNITRRYKDHQQPLVMTKFFFSISDTRVEQF